MYNILWTSCVTEIIDIKHNTKQTIFDLLLNPIKYIALKIKSKSSNGVEVDFNDSFYSVLQESPEIRLYKPQKRTIKLGEETYTINFPHMLFALDKSRFLKVAYSDEFGEIAIPIPYPNIRMFSCCLGDKAPTDLKEAIKLFWQTKFDSLNEYKCKEQFEIIKDCSFDAYKRVVNL